MSRTATANGPATAPAVEERPADAGLLDRVVEATRYTVRDVETIAKRTAASRLFGLDENQAFTLMMIAESEGLHPIQAVKRYHVIQGRPAMRADAMLAEFQRIGGLIRWHETSAANCSATLIHPRLCPDGQRVSYSFEEAKRAGLTDKPVWKQYPDAMLRARVISAGIRMVAPGIVVGIYTPEEVSDFADSPSPRPLPADATASRLEPVAGDRHADAVRRNLEPEAPAEPAPQAEPSEFWRWVQARLDDANNNWQMSCVDAKKPYQPLAKNVWQVVNGVTSTWVATEIIRADDVLTNGKRDRAKVKAMLLGEWDDFGEGREMVMDAVDGYLSERQQEVAREAGINLDAEPKEEALSNA